jgi:hypothetical protein
MFRMPPVLPSACKEAPNLADPLDQVILSLGAIETVTVKISGLQVVTGKEL